jgi:hypothetical protein
VLSLVPGATAGPCFSTEQIPFLAILDEPSKVIRSIAVLNGKYRLDLSKSPAHNAGRATAVPQTSAEGRFALSQGNEKRFRPEARGGTRELDKRAEGKLPDSRHNCRRAGTKLRNLVWAGDPHCIVYCRLAHFMTSRSRPCRSCLCARCREARSEAHHPTRQDAKVMDFPRSLMPRRRDHRGQAHCTARRRRSSSSNGLRKTANAPPRSACAKWPSLSSVTKMTGP